MNVRVCLAKDLGVMGSEEDLERTMAYRGVAVQQPESRGCMREWLSGTGQSRGSRSWWHWCGRHVAVTLQSYGGHVAVTREPCGSRVAVRDGALPNSRADRGKPPDA